MPTIEITDAQAETLDDLRDELTTEYIDEYGYIRPCDAIQYLIDRYTAADEELVAAILEERLRDCSYQQLQHIASRTDGVDATGKAGDLRHRLATARTRLFLDLSTWTEATTEPSATGDHLSASDSDGDASEAASDASSLNTAASSPGSVEGAASSRLERMMGLLDEYNDRWEEADTDGGKYVVTLPDNSTEAARTKEDVRALLFQHYE